MMKISSASHSSQSIRYLFFLLSLTIILTGMGIFGGDFWWSDESRHAMDGVFFLDALKDLPIFHPYKYGEVYYAKYPALIFTWYPPLFASVESVFYTFFGISQFSAKLTVMFFLSVGIIAWYALIKKLYNQHIAFYSGLLFVTNPLVQIWARTVMLEVPTTAMVILSVYCFYQYFERDEKRYAYYLALSICAALYTKQTAGFILPAFLSYIVLRKKYSKLFQKESLIAYGILLILLLPLLIFTLEFGTTGLRATVGDLAKTGESFLSRWEHYIKILGDYVLPWPVLFASLLACGFHAINTKKWKKSSFFFLWILWWYICFSYIFGERSMDTHYRDYYGIYVVPPFCLLAILAINSLQNRLSYRKIFLKRHLLSIVGITIGIYQIFLSCTGNISSYIDTIYDEAAKFVVQHPKGATVLINAYYDGTFIFHVRKYDEQKRMAILRADKMLVSLAVHQRYGVFSHVKSEDDIYEMLQNYGTGYIVTEEQVIGEHKGIEPLNLLRKVIQSDKFRLVKKIPSSSSNKWFCSPYKHYKDITLLIYEYQDMTTPQAQDLVIEFPHIKKEIRVPFDLLSQPWKEVVKEISP